MALLISPDEHPSSHRRTYTQQKGNFMRHIEVCRRAKIMVTWKENRVMQHVSVLYWFLMVLYILTSQGFGESLTTAHDLGGLAICVIVCVCVLSIYHTFLLPACLSSVQFFCLSLSVRFWVCLSERADLSCLLHVILICFPPIHHISNTCHWFK